jgi:hypothetical protein
MDIKEEGIQLPMGYLSLDDCIKGWGPKGRNMFDGLVRQSLKSQGYTTKEIHTPTDGNSFQSEESPTPFIPFMKGSKKI